ncbi:DNA binding methylated-DNA--cysteine S-methyltransferase [Basidiobolus meristosporus CBS 931.73]|uniref:Methylated-DNA--protein-cysteine methyltransferase n=1 Tax=Basidiobolus meristosporus CBS 931.73 TaxID=1314790 RepID=A0A1Y1YV52_9FUNG|nr:DNA binding methylated-DNA--cysteine S-methyltransferase [Basidiobolus meristosporus CBS 931.73]|eukprot:ORY01918.1 DNA binding methylated-DNA--cysteine S-methyltransferase [Basidiobolus meristosporus CBS 931.73]
MPTRTQRISPYNRKCKSEKLEKKVQVEISFVEAVKETKKSLVLEKEAVDSDVESKHSHVFAFLLLAKPHLLLAVKLFPRTKEERVDFQNQKTNRKVTEFQFRVYDLCSQIPSGWFSTYKAISNALQASPRAVGQALKKNPFAPLPVPCHRVLSSNCFIGGFDGDWGSGNKINSKRAKLEKEGLAFDKQQVLLPVFQNTRLFTNFKVYN